MCPPKLSIDEYIEYITTNDVIVISEKFLPDGKHTNLTITCVDYIKYADIKKYLYNVIVTPEYISELKAYTGSTYIIQIMNTLVGIPFANLEFIDTDKFLEKNNMTKENLYLIEQENQRGNKIMTKVCQEGFYNLSEDDLNFYNYYMEKGCNIGNARGKGWKPEYYC